MEGLFPVIRLGNIIISLLAVTQIISDKEQNTEIFFVLSAGWFSLTHPDYKRCLDWHVEGLSWFWGWRRSYYEGLGLLHQAYPTRTSYSLYQHWLWMVCSDLTLDTGKPKSHTHFRPYRTTKLQQQSVYYWNQATFGQSCIVVTVALPNHEPVQFSRLRFLSAIVGTFSRQRV